MDPSHDGLKDRRVTSNQAYATMQGPSDDWQKTRLSCRGRRSKPGRTAGEDGACQDGVTNCHVQWPRDAVIPACADIKAGPWNHGSCTLGTTLPSQATGKPGLNLERPASHWSRLARLSDLNG